MQPQPGATNTTSDLSPPETVSSSSLKFSHLLSGLLRLPLQPHSFQPLQLIQNAVARLVFNLPRPSHVIPLIQSHTGCLCWIQNPAAGKQGCKGTHTCTPTGHCPGLHTPALLCFFCHHWPFGSPVQFTPGLAVVPVVPTFCLFTSSIPLPHIAISPQIPRLCLFHNYLL